MALNPLGLTPLALLVVLLSVVGLGFVSEPWDRRLTRFSRRLFGRYVGASPERKRVLESAYIGETYRGYAARTYLFTAIAAVCGALGGAYLVGLLLLAIPTIVDLLLGLPNTMVNALGIRGFELVLAPTRTLAVLAAGGVFTGAGAAGLTYILRWELPKNTAAVRRRNIEEGMPRNIAFMYALARGGMSFPDIVRVLGRNQDIYGDMSREISIAVREMDLFGRDVISSLQHVSHRTPSEKMKTFTENLSSVLQSGQSLESFLRDQYERHQEDAAQRQADIIESLATIAEAYVTIFVAGVLFLITILLVFGLTTTDTLPFLQLLAYLAIPLANAGFMVYLSSKMEALGISDSGTTDVLDRLETTTFGKPAVRPETGVTDGGHVDTATDNWARLRLYDRVRRVKRILRSPVETLVWNPTQVLYVAVPVAVLAFALRAPAAFQTSIVNVRLLDDLLVQSALLVLGAFAVVRFVYVRRVARIEQATPELLERLASLNEAGMTIVESIRRVRGNDVGVLTPEVKRIWADIRMGQRRRRAGPVRAPHQDDGDYPGRDAPDTLDASLRGAGAGPSYRRDPGALRTPAAKAPPAADADVPGGHIHLLSGLPGHHRRRPGSTRAGAPLGRPDAGRVGEPPGRRRRPVRPLRQGRQGGLHAGVFPHGAHPGRPDRVHRRPARRGDAQGRRKTRSRPARGGLRRLPAPFLARRLADRRRPARRRGRTDRRIGVALGRRVRRGPRERHRGPGGRHLRVPPGRHPP